MDVHPARRCHGPLGVVGALAAVDELRHRGFQPSRPIGVVNFVDEEGARFGVACAGSRVITGAMSADRARGLTDADGVSMAEAMRSAGRDPETLGRDDETLARIGTFVELHVEQGRALVDLGHAVGVGSDIWPHGRWRIDVPGEANHAGTTALADRDGTLHALQQHGAILEIGREGGHQLRHIGDSFAAAVNVERLAQMFPAHCRTFDMPAGTAPAPRRIPTGLVVL